MEGNPALHFISKLLVCRRPTSLKLHTRFGDLSRLAAEWLSSWMLICCTLPTLLLVSAGALWEEHKHTKKNNWAWGKCVHNKHLLLFFSLPIGALIRQLPGNLNEDWSIAEAVGHLGFSFPPLQNRLCNYPGSYNPEVGWTECFLQVMCNRDTVWYFQGKEVVMVIFVYKEKLRYWVWIVKLHSSKCLMTF